MKSKPQVPPSFYRHLSTFAPDGWFIGKGEKKDLRKVPSGLPGDSAWVYTNTQAAADDGPFCSAGQVHFGKEGKEQSEPLGLANG